MFYDQIVNDNTNSLLLFAEKNDIGDRPEELTEIELLRKKKHDKFLSDMNQRVKDYTYKI